MGCEPEILLSLHSGFLHFLLQIWYVQLWVKRTVDHWQRNNESTLKLLCFLNGSWNLNNRLWLLKIIHNLINKETIIIVRKMCEYIL